MLLKKVFEYIQKKGVINPQEIIKDLEISADELDFALRYWEGQGKIKKANATQNPFSCAPSSCHGCKGC